MSDAVLVAVAASLPPTLMALASLIQSQRNGKKADKLAGVTNEIHVMADGNLTRVTSELNIANQKIEGLEKLVKSIIDRRQV